MYRVPSFMQCYVYYINVNLFLLMKEILFNACNNNLFKLVIVAVKVVVNALL